MGKTLPVVWAEEAVRDAVRRVARALQTVDKDALLLGKLGVTTQDLWCLVDAGRATLGQADAVSDAVASAHLSGVDLPADWVDTLGKVASGEVTADDAVQAVVDDELRRRIASRIVEAWVGREPLTIVAYADALARQAMEVVTPALRKAYLDGHDVGFAAANVPDPWAKTPAVDGDLQHQIVRSLWDAAEICLSDSQLSVMADAVISDVVAPRLAAADAALEWERTSKQQYAEERDEALDDVEKLRSALSMALADLVVRRQALANVLGVTDAGGASGYYRMIQDVADLRAELGAIRARAQLAEDERDKANRQNESLARRLHLRFQNEQKLSAELGGARDLLGELELYVSWRYITGKLTTEQRELWADAVERWNPDPSDTPPPRQVDRWWRDDAPVGQPDTEATEQAPREPRVWSVSDVEPAGVTAVTTPGGAVFYRSDDRRWRSESVMHGQAFTWSDLVNGYPFVTEVIADGTQ